MSCIDETSSSSTDCSSMDDSESTCSSVCSSIINRNDEYLESKYSDAPGFIRKVIVHFRHRPKDYEIFEQITTDFAHKKIDIADAIFKYVHLFKKNPEFIEGLNVFFYPENKIDVTINGQQYSFVVNTSVPDFTTGFSKNLPIIEGSGNVINDENASIEVLENYIDTYASEGQMIIIRQALKDSKDDRQRFMLDPAKFNKAMAFLLKVKQHFRNEPHKYNSFLEILQPFRAQQLATLTRGQENVGNNIPDNIQNITDDIHKKMIKLFENNKDLIAGFESFLPDITGLSGELYKLTI